MMSLISTSDERLKENVSPIKSGQVDKISGVEFDWKELSENEKIYIHGNTGHDVGVIKEIEQVLPSSNTKITGTK